MGGGGRGGMPQVLIFAPPGGSDPRRFSRGSGRKTARHFPSVDRRPRFMTPFPRLLARVSFHVRAPGVSTGTTAARSEGNQPMDFEKGDR